jgi:ankyrin repeat protein
LIEQKADVRQRDRLDRSALDWAARSESTDMLRLLLSLGADPHGEEKSSGPLFARKALIEARKLVRADALVAVVFRARHGPEILPKPLVDICCGYIHDPAKASHDSLGLYVTEERVREVYAQTAGQDDAESAARLLLKG